MKKRALLQIIWLTVVLSVIAGSSSWAVATNQAVANNQMSHEESIIRKTYARLAFAVQINEVHKAISQASDHGRKIDPTNLHTRLGNAALVFQLSDFKVGNVTDSDIGHMKYEDLVTKPSGDSLDVATGYWSYGTDQPRETQSAIASVQWQPSQQISEDWTLTWAKIFPHIENSSWLTRYASFKVRVTYGGRSREYRAMFIFGKNPAGEDYIVPVDTVSGLTGGLAFFLRHNAYPEALIEGGLGKDPAIHQWLNQQSLPGKTHDDNCDVLTLKCGVSLDDLKKIDPPLSNLHRKPYSLHAGAERAITKPRLIEASFRPPIRLFAQASSPTGCAQFSTTNSHVGFVQDFGRHQNPGAQSNHTLTSLGAASCTYTDGAAANCNTECKILMAGSSIGDVGPTTGFCHSVAKQIKNDDQFGTGAGANCGGGSGGGVKECLACACGVNVSISSNGATVSITSDGFFTADDGFGQSCAVQTKPTPTPTPTPPPPPDPPSPPPDPCLDATVPLSSGSTGQDYSPDCSPVIIDYSGKGFFLTSVADGVKFDISGTGHPVQMGWTAVGADNAFLALPDKNGDVNNGKELFGNFTPQPASSRPNGYAALAVYDLAENGGNGDGVIDAHDAVFASLRLWVDKNHDGVAQPEELYTLPALGVFSISLDYRLSHRQDEFGNVFRYRAKVNPHSQGDTSEVGPWSYDVFFTTH